ncbi:MAG: hypothetical protein GOMPHAMPRED_005028 [Gomphillus americanus]|uniref:Acireductone dioxygenase n=1 Tax=Gomphillus americanus TaxID=1940652 RepID=A0A8H3EKB3_9LECA|nr:MAG: hypothetical protein GOMPHAMPRED_005028 [Gomphillus americanus]
MKAYYYDNVEGDPRLPHITPDGVSVDHLATLGLLHARFPLEESNSIDGVNKLASDRHYSHRDEITVSPSAMGAVYEDKIKNFFAEHMHEDEEIRYILGGAGYFDIREKGDDNWIRIRVEEGDLLVLPPGIYHRFTVDEDNVSSRSMPVGCSLLVVFKEGADVGQYIKAMRLFKDEPKWTPLNRGQETEQNSFRKEYVHQRQQQFQSSVTA